MNYIESCILYIYHLFNLKLISCVLSMNIDIPDTVLKLNTTKNPKQWHMIISWPYSITW